MQANSIIWIVLISRALQATSSTKTGFNSYDNYYDFEPEVKDAVSLNSIPRPNRFNLNGLTRSDIMKFVESLPPSKETTECITVPTVQPSSSQPSPEHTGASTEVEQSTAASKPEVNVIEAEEKDDKPGQLQNLVQLLYIAQARVQLEAAEIKKAQAVANSAQQSLEEAAARVRIQTANLQVSQQEVASAAIRAQTAQLQLAAHDQLLFAARQDVNALSTQLVGLQAAEGVTQPKSTVDITDLLEKLKQPLSEDQRPTPIPSVFKLNNQDKPQLQDRKFQNYNGPDY